MAMTMTSRGHMKLHQHTTHRCQGRYPEASSSAHAPCHSLIRRAKSGMGHGAWGLWWQIPQGHNSRPSWGGRGAWHKASVSDCLPLATPIGLSPLLILTLCGPERVLVVSWGGGAAASPHTTTPCGIA